MKCFNEFSVGYNDREMVLDGQFSYEDYNQRALPFNVFIKEISPDLKTYVGANSESVLYFNVHFIHRTNKQQLGEIGAIPLDPICNTELHYLTLE